MLRLVPDMVVRLLSLLLKTWRLCAWRDYYCEVPVAGLLTLCALWRMVHAKPDPGLLSVLDGGRAGSKRILLLPLIFGNGGKWRKPPRLGP